MHTGSFYESKRFNKDYKFDAGKVYAIKGAFIQTGEKTEKTFDVVLIKEGDAEADRSIQKIKDWVKQYDPSKDTDEVKKWRSHVSNILKRGTENNVKTSPLGNDQGSGALEVLSSEDPMRIRDQVRRLRTERNYKPEYLSECIRILENYLANPDKSKMALDMISWVEIYLGESRCR